MEKIIYKVTFSNEKWFMTPDEVLNFVKIAILHNRDISKATIERM